MRVIKRLLSATAAIALVAAFTVPARAEGEVSVSAKSAILLEANTGQVLYEKNPDERMQIASTTKLMTALVALENSSLDDIVEVDPAAQGVEGSSMYLRAGERLTMRELLYGLMLESGNDAAVAVACHISGGVQEFSKLMNERAESLGLENTHYVNPHGLTEEGHYSSARDLALLMAEAMNNSLFAQLASTRSISFGDRTFKNHNKLMWSYEGMLSGKTGYTEAAGRTLVTCAERDGMRLICVTLRDGDDWNDHVALYDMAFGRWKLVRLASAGEVAARVPVVSGLADSVPVAARESVCLLVDKAAEVELVPELPPFVYADVTAGERAGSLVALLDGEEAARAELYFAEDVGKDESVKLSGMDFLKRLFGAIYKSDGE